MTLLEHLLKRRRSPRDHRQAAVKPLTANDLVDRVGPLRRVLLAYVESAPVGEFDERRARVPGAERVKHSLLEVGKDSVLVNEHNAQAHSPILGVQRIVTGGWPFALSPRQRRVRPTGRGPRECAGFPDGPDRRTASSPGAARRADRGRWPGRLFLR